MLESLQLCVCLINDTQKSSLAFSSILIKLGSEFDTGSGSPTERKTGD